eukprot:2356990-Pleurochrysis_carterae.AAC.4
MTEQTSRCLRAQIAVMQSNHGCDMIVRLESSSVVHPEKAQEMYMMASSGPIQSRRTTFASRVAAVPRLSHR